ncbi:MAG TPA: ABC transporter permease [Kofleriaceae bacterium]|nr:ABC transporter permease [Kofleriaceae bacterium]
MTVVRHSRLARACLAYLAAVVVFCVVGPLLASTLGGLDGTTQHVGLGATPPSLAHPFGTDLLGRDMLVRVMLGGRLALVVALIATSVALVLGVAWGAIAAYAGGRIDFVMMRIVDVLYGFPVVVFVIVVMAVLGTKNLVVLFLLIGAINWMTMSRIVRGQVLALRRREFVEAARAMGARADRIVLRHLIPNSLGPIIVYATLQLPHVMLSEAFLSFLGVGVQAPAASWGTLVAEGADTMRVCPWLLAAPALVMTTTILALNLLGDRIRDAFDPAPRQG